MAISFKKAFDIVMDSAPLLGTERRSILDNSALGRVLREDVTSDMDLPPFNKAAMDGYACRRRDLADELEVVATIPAGSEPRTVIGKGQCAKIMTGAPVPEGADCVVMIEHTELAGPGRIRFTGTRTLDNICLRGEDVRAGDFVLRAGQLIKAQHIAVLATVGWTEPLVSVRPRVGVIATGSEIVDPASKPAAGQIRNSNAAQLSAQIAAAGLPAVNHGIAADSKHELGDAIDKASAGCDVVILSGGVSVGDYDFVREVLRDKGVKLIFEKVAVKPGRPTVFGSGDGTWYFGLPGNPVSTFVLFELLVKPFLFKMMGHDLKTPICHRTLSKTIRRTKADRDAWLPVAFTHSGRVIRVEYHGSAHINALCRADGLLCMPAGIKQLEEGTTVAVRQI